MTTFNNKGLVLRADNGRLIEDSPVSAYTRRRAVTNYQLEPVEGCPGLFVRIAVKELPSVTKAQRREVHDQARAWYMTVHGEGWIAETDEQLDRHDQLAAGVGREVSDADAPSGVTFVTPEESDGEDAGATLDAVNQALDEPDGASLVLDTDYGRIAYGTLTIDDVTLDDLAEMARALEITGRSKMDKEALFQAVRSASEDKFFGDFGE